MGIATLDPSYRAWTKAFAQANGDEKQTKVLYIKARVHRLISDQRKRLDHNT